MTEAKDHIGATVRVMLDDRIPKARKMDNHTGTFPIKLRVIYRRKTSLYSIKLKASKENFGAAMIGKGKLASNISSIQKDINKEVARAQKICKELGSDFTFEDFAIRFRGNTRKQQGVYDLWEEVTKEREQSGQFGTAQSYRNALDSFKGVTREDKLKHGSEKKRMRKGFRRSLEWKDVTPGLIKQYETWMEKEGVSRVSIGIYLRAFRVIVNQAIIKGFMKESPFGDPKHNKYRIPGPGSKKNTAITLPEIQAIASYPLVGRDAFYRDMFIVQFLMGGAYPMEVANLKWTDIHNDEIRFFRVKTKRTAQNQKQIVIKITPPLAKIIEEHGDKSSSFVFAILEKKMSDIEQWRHVKGTFTKAVNTSIGKVGKALKIDHVSAKVARHSAATLFVQAGLNLQEIADMLGHQSTAVTERYISSLTTSLPGRAADVLKLQ
jgi:integrase